MADPTTTQPDDGAAQKKVSASARIDALEAELRTMKADSNKTIDELRGELRSAIQRIAELEARAPAMNVQTPEPMTAAQVLARIEKSPAATFKVLNNYPALGVRPGDIFDPRQRVENKEILASHVTRGLRLCAA